MKIKKCRICKNKKIKKLFSLGNLCFTGKFPSINQEIKKCGYKSFNIGRVINKEKGSVIYS